MFGGKQVLVCGYGEVQINNLFGHSQEAITWSLYTSCTLESALPVCFITGKNNGFPFLDIVGYLKNIPTKNPKFGRVTQIPIWELGWEFPDWDLSHFAKFGILWVFFKYPKTSKNGNPLFFPV